MSINSLKWLIVLPVSRKGFAGLKCKLLFLKDLKIAVCCPVECTLLDASPVGKNHIPSNYVVE